VKVAEDGELVLVDATNDPIVSLALFDPLMELNTAELAWSDAPLMKLTSAELFSVNVEEVETVTSGAEVVPRSNVDPPLKAMLPTLWLALTEIPLGPVVVICTKLSVLLGTPFGVHLVGSSHGPSPPFQVEKLPIPLAAPT